jgi:SAM-dependent methyltransferase
VDEGGQPLSVTGKGRLAALLSQRGPQVVGAMLDAAEDVLAVMRAEGVEGFLAYGTLLGAVRAGRVIAHDYDADLSYLSAREYPVDAIGESYRLERAIRARGYLTRRYSAMAFQVGLDPADPHHPWVDVFGSLIVGQTLYVMWDVGAPLRRDQVMPLTTRRLEGRQLPVPRDAEAWLSATYGPSWRVPDPTFAFSTPPSVTRRLSGWFGRLNRGHHEWSELHGEVDEEGINAEPSDFARWVAERAPDADALVDIGCGTGSDTSWYAREPYAGRTVLGLDFSATALEKATALAARTGSPASFRPLNLADLRSVLLTGAALTRLPRRKAMTSRFLVDGLIRPERQNLWLLARMVLREEGLMYVEVARARDPRRRAFADVHRLRFLPIPVLRAELEESGATIHERQVVESPPDCLVPDTIRMVLSWPR